MAAICTIGNTVVTMIEDMHDHQKSLDERGRFQCDIWDETGTLHFLRGERVTVVDSVLGLYYNGFINTDKEVPIYPFGGILHSIDCIDLRYIADKRTFTETYLSPVFAGKILIDTVLSTLLQEGITKNFSLQDDNTTIEFNRGVLSNTAANTIDNTIPDLELAPSGTDISFSANTTAEFNLGTFFNSSAASNAVTPTTTPAIKMTSTLNSNQVGNTITSVQIWTGSVVMGSGGNESFINYDIFIDPSSPAIAAGLNIFFNDGTNTSTSGSLSGGSVDGQFILPGTSNDLTGLANVQWYNHGFAIGAQFGGKTAVSISMDIAGTSPGNYIVYVRNVNFSWLTGTPSPTIIFNGTLNVNPPRQLQNYGYVNTFVSVVNTYDLYSFTTQDLFDNAKSNYLSQTFSISAVKLYQSSFLSWDASIPANTSLKVWYYLDDLNEVLCTNNAPLPYIPPGYDLTGKHITLDFEFFALQGANPEVTPVLRNFTLNFNTSYNVTKTDLTYAAAFQADWNAGTLTNLFANAQNELNINGAVRNWDDGDFSSQTLYKSTAFPEQSPNNRAFTIWNNFSGSNLNEARSRMDFAGTWQNFTAEIDVELNPADPVQRGFIYRTTNWGNNSGTGAYYAWVTSGFVLFGKGTNSSGGSSTTQTLLVSTAATNSTSSWHRFRIDVSGTSHKVYLDEVLYVNTTDSTYSAGGFIALYMQDGGSTASSPYTCFFDNFGILAALSGTWISPGNSLSGVGTYGTSVISWRDKSQRYNGNSNTTILVEASYDNGVTYATCINGSPLPTLTNGTSLSGKILVIRITLSTTTASSLTAVDNLTVRIVGSIGTITGTRSTQPEANDMSITRTVASGWGTSFAGETITQVGTATTSVGSGVAILSNTTGDVHMVYGSRTWTDEDETIDFSLSNSSIFAGLELRYVDANNHYRLEINGTSLSIIKVVSGTAYTLTSIAITINTNTQYYMRFRVVGSSSVTLYGKYWLAGTLEPGIVNGTESILNPMWSITVVD